MFRRGILLAGILLATAAAVGSNRLPAPIVTLTATPLIGGPAQTAAGASYDLVPLTLPKGETRAGRQAFLDLGCAACHRVTGEPGLPAPISSNPGPELGPALAGRPTGSIATAIVAPSHSMSLATSDAVKAQIEGVLSPMGDYSHAMTVRQLLDLLAFLDSLNR